MTAGVGGAEGDSGRRARSGKAILAFVAVLLVAAVLVARGCDRNAPSVSREDAVETARRAVDFEPTQTSVRLVRQGVQSRPAWAISFSTTAGGSRIVTVVVDGQTGDVTSVSRETG